MNEVNEKKAFRQEPDVFEHLKEIAIYLEGIKQGKGNIQPLGFIHIESLWDVYKTFKFESEEGLWEKFAK